MQFLAGSASDTNELAIGSVLEQDPLYFGPTYPSGSSSAGAGSGKPGVKNQSTY